MAEPRTSTPTSESKETRKGDEAQRGDPAIRLLTDELAEIESELRDLHLERADLLKQLADESEDRDPDPDRLRESRARLRQADRRFSDLENRRAQVLRDIDDEYRSIARSAGRRRRRVVEDRCDEDRYVVDDREPLRSAETAYGPGGMMGGGPITRAINETGRLGNALALGHLGALGATAEAVSVLAEDLFARGLARSGRPMEASMAMPADINAGLWKAADRLVSGPQRAVDSFYHGYRSTG